MQQNNKTKQKYFSYTLYADGEIFVSKSSVAADHPECGDSLSPCKTLLYAATRCNKQACHYKIDGGSEQKAYEYTINHKEEFSSHAEHLTLNGFGSHLPIITCKDQDAYDTCIFASGYHFSTTGISFQASAVGNYLPAIFLSGNLMEASLSDSVFTCLLYTSPSPRDS